MLNKVLTMGGGFLMGYVISATFITKSNLELGIWLIVIGVIAIVIGTIKEIKDV